jgi:hypothetical protein
MLVELGDFFLRDGYRFGQFGYRQSRLIHRLYFDYF